MEHLDSAALEAGLQHIREAPSDVGTLDLIVRRPDVDQREVLSEGELDIDAGLLGDNWSTRGSSQTDDGSAHPLMQLNLINSRLIAHVCPDPDRRHLAGDQMHVDMDLSQSNLPPWTRLQIGEAVIEVTDQPHTGCAKFVRRFGKEAMRFVNSPRGRELGLRGICARVVEPGIIRQGDQVKKL